MDTGTQTLFDQVSEMLQSVQQASISNAAELEQFRIEFIGSKGKVKDLLAAIKDVAPSEKKAYGQVVNQLKQAAEAKYNDFKEQFEAQIGTQATDIDLSLPGDPIELGARHPVQLVRQQIVDIFVRMGYSIAEGPEIEDDWHNFSALNFPPYHPARDMQDTFFVYKDATDPLKDIALRTHTSSVQVRVMETTKPPIRSIMPGRVYRNETVSARSHCFFHQVEGLYIDRNVSFADLKQTLLHFAREFYGAESKIRLRPSYFPFTEPSAEMDVTCFICGGTGCNVCKHSGWVEVLGCGMVDPAVLDNCGIDSNEYTGFAFGIGIERTAMLKYGINDLRLFSENDIRLLRQFRGAV
ncbi:MAG: phenylalanine--tRNA ligase subunit alpha [Chitinophagales bacterium]|nr:phenylalanine--tRNA ligase subunit alpha [Chitinophagales bacterium]